MELSNLLKRISLLILISYIISFYITLLFYEYPSNNYAKLVNLAQNNLKKNYIQNVRVIGDGNDCQNNEVASSTQIKYDGYQYDLNKISIEKSVNNTKKLIKLCSERNINSSFDYLSNNQNKNTLLADDEACHYNGLKFLPHKGSTQCPVSDIIFSYEEEGEKINGYEKIGNKDDQGINVYIKRSDEKMTPLVAIQIVKNNELSFFQASLNLTFSMTDICEHQYGAYEAICSNNAKLDELEFRIVKENQIALDISCPNQLLIFNKEEFEFSMVKVNYYACLVFLDLLFIFISSIFLFESNDKLKENWEEIQWFILIVFLFNIFRQYQLYSEFDILLKATSINCYMNGNPFEFIISDLKVYYVFIHISILFSLSVFSLIIFNPLMKQIKKCLPQRYQRFDDQEMVPI